ncbi:MAG: alpha/beta hydrolase [Microthrixaceae bacterium]
MSIHKRAVRGIGAASLGVAVAGLASAVAVHVAGSRIRRAEDPEIDNLLDIQSTVRHHYVSTPDGAMIHVAERIGKAAAPLHSELSDSISEPSQQTVLLLHGVTLQWWVWGAQFNSLSDRHRVLAWDMRGHGESTVGSDAMKMEAIANDLAAVLEHFELTETIIVGHSMGGMALGAFCAEHSAIAHRRVSGLMFLASSAATMAIPALTGGAIGMLQLLASTRLDVRQPDPARLWRNNNLSVVLVRWAFGRHPTAQAVEQVRRMLADSSPVHSQDAARSIATHDVLDDLGHIAIPSLVVVGDMDRLTPPVHSEMLVQALPKAQLRVLPGIGHQVMQEDPQALDRLINELSSLTQAPPS